MQKISFVLLTLFCCISCSKPFIGMPVTYYDEFWCICGSEPKYVCYTTTTKFDFSFIILKKPSIKDKTKVESIIEVSAVWTGYKGWNVTDLSFAFILANDQIITDYFSFLPNTKKIDRELRFNRSFTSDPYDAIGIGYKLKGWD